MNWKLVFQLSLFGLVMAIGTLTLISQSMEWIFWPVILIFSAYVIAKRRSDKYFLHGFFVSIFNCIWILLVHLIFFDTFSAHHAAEMDSMMKNMPANLQVHPRLVMSVTCVIIGITSGIVLGLFAVIASKIVKHDAPKVEV